MMLHGIYLPPYKKMDFVVRTADAMYVLMVFAAFFWDLQDL
jgi:hypothetical protein